MGRRPSNTVPLVGYMSTYKVAWRRRRALFREVAADARRAGVSVILFNWHGVDFERKRVRGWVPKGKRWVKAVRPLPDAVLDMTAYSSVRRQRAASAVCTKLAEVHGIPFVNRVPSFGKWEIHQVLSASPETRHLVPETVQFRGRRSLRRMLQRHRIVYVKYGYGSRGTSVMRIRPEAKGWRLEGRCRSARIDQGFTTRRDLYRFLRALRLEDRGWVLQQGIDSPRVQGWPFDLRVVVQKDGRGKWDVALSVVRWATRSQVACNLAQGAKQLDIVDFARRFGRQVKGLPTLQAEAAKASLQVAKVLGDHFGTLGDVGVDVGIDRSGRVWVFEVNSKPMRMLGYSMHRRIFEYARYLAQRKKKAPG